MKKARLLSLPMVLWTFAFVGVTLVYIVALSFLKRDANLGVTTQLTLENYEKLANPAYLKVLGNSLLLAAQTTLICLFIGYPFGYLMARATPRWRNILLLLVIVPFWTNALIRIYGWKILLAANGPVNNVLSALGLGKQKLLNTNGAVLLGMVYALLPFMILPAYTSVEKMDWSVNEAARDLGASRLRAFLTTTVPMTRSGILAGCLLTFVPAIGLFFLNDLLGGSKVVLAGNLISDTVNKSRDLPFAAALSVVLLALTAVIMAVYRKAGGKNENMVF